MKKFISIISILAFSMISAMVLSAACATITMEVHPLVFAVPIAGYGILGIYHLIPFLDNALCTNFGSIANMTIPDVDGREAMGGFTATAYLAFISEIETFPTLPDIETVTDVGDLVKLIGSFVMKQGKYFYEVKVPPSTSKFTPAGQGEIGGKSFKPKGDFFIPGVDDQSMGLARMCNNKFGIVILTDPDGKHRICIGTNDLPCTFSPTGEGGQKPADRKGFTFTFETDSFAPGWIYEGPIPLSGGDITGIS